MKQLTIILTSNEPWGEVWYSKQHYANELSELGHKVFFLNPPTKWEFSNLFHLSVEKVAISNTLVILDQRNNFPLRIVPRFFSWLNDFFNCWKLRRVVKTEELIFWQFDPFRFARIFFFRTKRIYHVVDPYFHLPLDKILAAKADLIPIVSAYYESYYPREKTFMVPHGVSQSESVIEESRLNLIREEVGEGYLLFAGTFNVDVDYDLLLKLAELPYQLLLVGPDYVQDGYLDRLGELLNVTYLGSRSAGDLKYFVKLAKACIVPYRKERTGNVHRTPLKIINYLAHHKPIVSTINYELVEFDELYIFVREEPAAFLDEVNKLMALSDTQAIKPNELLNNYLESIAYRKLISSIVDKLFKQDSKTS